MCNLNIKKKLFVSLRICLLPDERSERKMTPKNEDTFADLNPEFYDSVIFPVSRQNSPKQYFHRPKSFDFWSTKKFWFLIDL
jgi:hypothetical protein